MKVIPQRIPTTRYHAVTEKKASGATYTPKILADFVAQEMFRFFGSFLSKQHIRVLDPAVGHGELLVSLLENLTANSKLSIDVCGFETNRNALYMAESRIKTKFPNVSIQFEETNFIDFAISNSDCNNGDLFDTTLRQSFDLIIANPPYVRTQIMGSYQSQILSNRFNLSGRVDLYHAFIIGISHMLGIGGTAGIIVSNRFMTTKSGASIRRALLDRFDILHIWDLGDTKIFDAAVLPAILIVKHHQNKKYRVPAFTSIYQTRESAHRCVSDEINALAHEGIVEIGDGRRFAVRHGRLETGGTPDDIWRMTTAAIDTWLTKVQVHSWGYFRDIGKIRVGVKTCADKSFIRDDWTSLAEDDRPELLRPLTTHRNARRFKPLLAPHPTQILYPHEIVNGRRRPIKLSKYPRSMAYLYSHRAALESRRYVTKAGRKWYEIWVPQDPAAWIHPKLVFRDIAEKPTFWIDLSGTIVNGDCYWLTCRHPSQTDLLWLAAAVGNSTFIETFYDHRFNNKLYAGRRRFITQYVEQFPLPNPNLTYGKAIIATAKEVYKYIPSDKANELQDVLDIMVWKSFGFNEKEIIR